MKEYNKDTLRDFIVKEFRNDYKSLLRAVFNKQTVCYYEGKLDLAKEFDLTGVVIIEIATIIESSYKDWKDLFNTLNESYEVIKKYEVK